MPLASVTRRARLAFALPATLLAACGEKATVADAPVTVIATGLATPESVLWDDARNVWYVSNINGAAIAKDDNGYILRLTADGAMMDSLPFINGADADIVLNAPKGMALVGDTLWVADIDAVRGFNVLTGNVVTTLELRAQGATFLNDVAAAPDGTVYITDSGISFDAAGNLTHPGTSRVFALKDRMGREAVVLPAQSAANGLAWDPALNAWLIVGFNSTSIFAWVPGTDSLTAIGTGPGGGDGISVLADGRTLYSSWADSSLTILEDGVSTKLRGGLPAPADFGYDAKRGLVAVPLFQSDRIEFWMVK